MVMKKQQKSNPTLKKCPIGTALEHLGKKWTINLIRDLYMGKKRFKDFLASNTDISTKMLAARLKEMETEGFIEKKVISTSPVVVEYWLTEKGKGLNRVLYELACFSMKHYCKEVTGEEHTCTKTPIFLKKQFEIEV